jgi:hypothetical protein
MEFQEPGIEYGVCEGESDRIPEFSGVTRY